MKKNRSNYGRCQTVFSLNSPKFHYNENVFKQVDKKFYLNNLNKKSDVVGRLIYNSQVEIHSLLN